MKGILILIFGLFLLQPVLAINITVNQVSENGVMIVGLQEPAIFKLNVTNNGNTDDFSFYSFFGLGIEPKEPIRIDKGESKEVILSVYPREDSNLDGFTTFTYFIQAKDKSEIEKKLTVNVIKLDEAFEIGSGTISPESNVLKIYLHNKVDFDFKNLKVKFSSAFFEFERTISLKGNERINFDVEINQKEYDELMAGFYTLTADLEIENIEGKLQEQINFLEKDILLEEEKNFGLIIKTSIIQKINRGNVVADSTTLIQKNILSRIFTRFSPEPTVIDRKGFVINYYWDKSLNPGEIFEVQVTTNWLIPFIIILLIVLTIVFSRKYSETDLYLRKRVSFVNARGGEFALKVIINIEAKEFVENVKIIDKLPPLVKVYGRFGGEIPKRFHKKKKTFEWELDELAAGEKRILSYIIYSKVGVLGKFALPSATALFQKEGKMKQTSSNKAFFLAEQKE